MEVVFRTTSSEENKANNTSFLLNVKERSVRILSDTKNVVCVYFVLNCNLK